MKKLSVKKIKKKKKTLRYKELKIKRRTNRKIKKILLSRKKREELAALFGKKSKILGLLANHAQKKINVQKGVQVTIPKTFSIIDDPSTVIDTISQFSAVKKSGERPTQVFIDQSQMERYDLAASALLDLVAVELRKELKINNKSSRFRGRFPSHGPVARFIKAIGIVKHLGIRDQRPTCSEMQKLRVFDKRCRHYLPLISARASSLKERAASGFVEHLNSCLGANGKELTRDGVSQLSACLSELLDNAEEHANFTDWSLLGYLDMDDQQKKLEIAVFNFGRSIAETFTSLTPSHFARKAIEPYLQQHSSLVFKKHTKEDLITVMALQEHISSKNEDSLSSRGHGTIELLRFFSKIHQDCSNSSLGAEMALLSGNTFIRFDGTHLLSKSGKGDEKVIAFNKSNSLSDPPDQQYVRSLGKSYFPGTIISIRFPLTSAMVQEGTTK